MNKQKYIELVAAAGTEDADTKAVAELARAVRKLAKLPMVDQNKIQAATVTSVEATIRQRATQRVQAHRA